MEIGIIIDKWKHPFFKKNLTSAGYKFETHQGSAKSTFLLKTDAKTIEELKPLVKRTNQEAHDAV